MLRLIKRNVVSQTQRVVRTLTCDTHGLWAKFSVAPPARQVQAPMSLSQAIEAARIKFVNSRHQEMTQKVESLIKGKTFEAEPFVDQTDRRSVERTRQAENLANQRQVVEATLVKYKYHQHLMFQKKSKKGNSVAERKTSKDEPSVERSDRMSVEQKAGQAHKMMSQRWYVAPERLKFVKERHQQSVAEAEVRYQNATFYPTRQELHSGRLSKII